MPTFRMADAGKAISAAARAIGDDGLHLLDASEKRNDGGSGTALMRGAVARAAEAPATTSLPPTEDLESGGATVPAAPIAAGVIIGFLILMVIGYWLFRRNQNRKMSERMRRAGAWPGR
ncbi:hypothetical protein GQ53DRAFT_828083 [Thozetella sp. PMI_491]|nr:hypothetical protein GQ53DRAFT_828083 [Thozetella sp. PMI_491]